MQVYIETYGCSSNQTESETIAGLLEKAGVRIGKIEEADAVILNTCIVKQATENKIIYRLKQIQEKYPEKKLIIAGCMPEAEPSLARKTAPNASLVSTHHVTEIAHLVKKTLAGQKVELTGFSRKIKIGLPRIRKNPRIEIIPISSGCIGNCAFCITRLAKGPLFSYPEQKILEQIEKAVKEGCKEIWITGQDTGCYGFDSGTNLAELLKKIVEIKGDFKIRIGMMNPNNIGKILPELINAYKNEKIYKFLHLPVQSGSNKVLKLMNRHYTTEQFLKIVEKFRKAIPNLCLSTDVIIGFPGEKEEDFQKTLELIEKVKPDITNVSKFYARPKTKAAGMKKIKTQVLKKRSVKISEICRKISLKKNKEFIGKEMNCLITGKSKDRKLFARAENYKPVIIEKASKDFVKARIESAGSNYLKGTEINTT